ncbi:FecR family protein [Sinomicrobium soli]|uniref:FecR family protein n=1 Tax=Sinomicrobium sp. N-1-3-6 TaxID=2219864 RepID=UPI000DCB7419|nr:FecR domain-containing protein [Sinomicrobium sp. N-1-3-6]RAV29463.1 anti-sigma factor [Sinomicrobium sp. N-1-3-6]
MKNLIAKFITNTIVDEELKTLREWLADPKHQKTFEAYVRDYHDLNLAMTPVDLQKAYGKLRNMMDQEKHKARPVKKLWAPLVKYAAAALVLLSLGYLYEQGHFSSQQEDILIPGNEAVTLQLDNGDIEVIDPESSGNVTDTHGRIIGKQDKNKITYDKAANSTEAYNTLKVPYGKRFDVVLSDGTTVYLNAGTSLKYPVQFPEKGNRQVYITGEAFFDVAKDPQHPFVVNADALHVQVLGTRFNVAAYPEDPAIDVVLVEGSVSMYSREYSTESQKKILLKPGYIGVYKPAENSLTTKEVVTGVYTSWLDGELVFRNMPLKNILKRLERHYNITITNHNAALADKEFNASFGSEPVEKVLEYFKISYGIDFKIEDNKVIIK